MTAKLSPPSLSPSSDFFCLCVGDFLKDLPLGSSISAPSSTDGDSFIPSVSLEYSDSGAGYSKHLRRRNRAFVSVGRYGRIHKTDLDVSYVQLEVVSYGRQKGGRNMHYLSCSCMNYSEMTLSEIVV